MEYIKFTQDKNEIYQYTGASSIGISILGLFLESDTSNFLDDYKNWAHELNSSNPKYGDTAGGNCTNLEYEDGNIYLEDQYSEEKIPTRLKISRDQFIKILDEWEQKVVNADPKPKEIIIKQDGDQFFIETKV
jgi:hypothetical protein